MYTAQVLVMMLAPLLTALELKYLHEMYPKTNVNYNNASRLTVLGP